MNDIEKIVNSIIPDENMRKLYFILLQESINVANSNGSDKWGVYHQQDRIRLLVGNLIVVTISNKGIWLALDKDKLSKSKENQASLTDSEQWKWDTNGYPEYSVIPSKNGFYNPSEDLEVWSLLKTYLFTYIEKASQKYARLNISSQKKHSQELLNYLREFIKSDIPEPNYNNPINDIEEYKTSYSNLSKTERETIIKSRVGQGSFRNYLINYWKGCAITGCKVISLLRASHIKPWRDCNNEERLDVYNGLLLIPNLDSAFDNGFISFDNKGKIMISSKFNESSLEMLGINKEVRIRKIEDKHIKYLDYHRKEVFQR